MQAARYGLAPSIVHCPDVSLESTDEQKFVLDVVIVYSPITPMLTIAKPPSSSAAARPRADRKWRQDSSPDKPLYSICPPF